MEGADVFFSAATPQKSGAYSSGGLVCKVFQKYPTPTLPLNSAEWGPLFSGMTVVIGAE